MPEKLWASDYHKTLACQMRKKINPDTNKNYTNEEIRLYLYSNKVVAKPISNNKNINDPGEVRLQDENLPTTFTLNDIERNLAGMLSTTCDINIINTAIKLKEMQSKLQTQSTEEVAISKVASSTTTSDLVSIIKPIRHRQPTLSNESVPNDSSPDN